MHTRHPSLWQRPLRWSPRSPCWFCFRQSPLNRMCQDNHFRFRRCADKPSFDRLQVIDALGLGDVGKSMFQIAHSTENNGTIDVGVG